MPKPWERNWDGPTVENAERQEQGVPGPWARDWSTSSPPAVAQEQPAPSASRGPILDILDFFNDSATFGLWPRLMEATGIRPNETERLEAARQEAPWWVEGIGDLAGYAIPGAGLAGAVSKTVPRLAANTIPAIMGREGLAGAGLTTLDNAFRHGEFDIVDVLADGGFSAALAGGMSRLARLNPTERLRAAGSDLTDADLAASRQFHDTAEGVGIPLDNMEAISQMAGPRAAALEGQFESALSSPRGGVLASAFEAERSPIIRDTAEQMVADLGGGISPQSVTRAANQSLTDFRIDVNAQARPFYAAAESRHLPPNWVPRHEYINSATQRVLNNAGLMQDLTRQYNIATGRPGPIPTNSIIFNDAVRKELHAMAGAERAKPRANLQVAEGMEAQAQRLNDAMDRVTIDPTTGQSNYAQARSIVEQGMEELSDLRGTPLGPLANAGGTAASQAGTVFGVRTGADAANSLTALDRLGSIQPDMPIGILANHLDAAVSDVTVPPTTFANRALPTSHSMQLADDVLGGASPLVTARLNAARAVDPYVGSPFMEPSGTTPRVMSMDIVKDAGKGRAVEMMQDPNFMGHFVPDGQGGERFVRGQLGRPGPTVERAINMGRSAVAADGPSDWMDNEERERMRMLILLQEMGMAPSHPAR